MICTFWNILVFAGLKKGGGVFVTMTDGWMGRISLLAGSTGENRTVV